MSTRSRSWRRIAAASTVLGIAALTLGYLVSRSQAHYRPERQLGELHGVDVSHFQGPIDWEAVADDSIAFAYIKASEAGDWVDETFAANWAGARSVGIEVGAYHFFTLCRTGEDQAANFLRTVPEGESDLPFAVDLEFPNNCSARPPKTDLQRELNAFLDEVESATGEPVILYVEDEFDELYDIFATFDQATWERSLRERPQDERWVIWQASDSASVDGITGGVDLNLMSASCCSP